MTPAEFLARFPEFDGLDGIAGPGIQAALDEADPHFDVERWGDLYTQGLGNFVAHTLLMRKKRYDALRNAGDTDPPADAISYKAGDTEIKFSEKLILYKVEKSPYVSTEYGQQYLYLRDIVGAGALAV